MRIAILSLLVIAICCTSCSHSRKISSTSNPSSTSTSASDSTSSAARDGSSYEKAIIIEETSETKGVNAEYAWLKQNYPGYKMGSQSLAYKDGKPYDILNFETADGVKKSIYFDISKFFGKF